MTEKINSNDKGKANDKHGNAGGYAGIIFIAIVFLFRAGYNVFVYLGLKDLYYGEMKQQTFAAFFLMIAFFYLISAVGLLYKKRFAYYTSWLVVLPDIILSGFYMLYPAYALIGILLTLLTILFLVNARKALKPWNKTDKKVAAFIGLVLVVYLAFGIWAANQPKPEEFQKIVTQEAIDKNDVKICDKLVINRVYCLIDFAATKKNPNVCEMLSLQQDKDDCYLRVGNALNDSEVCKLIENDYVRGMCHGN